MGLFQTLRRALGLPGPEERAPADLRRRVEEAIDRDEVGPLADLLRKYP
jgi:hypothetical protein